ncbi:uncharacterized protein B0H64DRAFT_3377 [Chaetomium fimeti]|uniref:Uncharacterized protein n=1 Tax=Chaetomium fimeti TaxID=1854472 RepID=A0AAE0HPH4_9PEZI|nr:hypothetical protein B0H64DRAFT_3377 [Chaetomium fimeti]
MASVGSGQSGVSVTKITKARGKMVKPILKRLSHSEKNSLDLDRGWDEQQIEQLAAGGWDGALGYAGQARDVSFGFAGAPGAGEGDAVAAMGGGSAIRSNLKFQHGRSGSQTSGGSGPRAAFVHPFAQTPRTSTPPLSYANSLASFDNGRDCSPTITETEDDVGFDTSATAFIAHAPTHPPPAGTSQANLQRPSLNSQRTASFPETPASKPPSLRINTGRSVSGTTATSSRLAHNSVSSPSHSELNLDSHNLSVSLTGTLDSPTGSLGGGSVIASPQQQSQLSPLRTSLDMGVFPRLRNHSEWDTAARGESIRAARRKFEEREREKEEKYDREMIRKRERRDNKEASRIEKGETPSRPSMHRKKTPTGLSTVSEPGPKPTKPKQSAPHFGFSAPAGHSGGIVLGIGKRRHSDSPTTTAKSDKQMGFAARRYESVSVMSHTPPSFGVTADEVRFDQAQPRRVSSAKRKTQGYWQGFLLWLRTKLLRMSTR